MKLEMLRRACNKLPACRLLPTRRRGVGRAGGGEGTQATNAVVSADHKQRYNMADCWFGQRAVLYNTPDAELRPPVCHQQYEPPRLHFE